MNRERDAQSRFLPTNGLLKNDKPELLKEWNYDLNTHLDLNKITSGSDKKANWICKRDQSHTWIAVIKNRSLNNHECPKCRLYKPNKENSINFLDPDLLLEWDYEKNIFKPEEVSRNSSKNIWWICLENPEHKFSFKIKNKVSRNKKVANDKLTICPICSGKHINDKNSLLALYPEICKEWDYEQNQKMDPNQISAHSSKKVWWICKNNNKHQWLSSINNRTRKIRPSGCPRCNKRQGSNAEQEFFNSLNYSQEYRGKTLKLNDKIIYPDVLIEDKNIVIEFDGDNWHGNLTKNNPDKIHSFTNKTYKQLWEETLNKRNLYHSHKIDTISIWESDWYKIKSKNLMDKMKKYINDWISNHNEIHLQVTYEDLKEMEK